MVHIANNTQASGHLLLKPNIQKIHDARSSDFLELVRSKADFLLRESDGQLDRLKRKEQELFKKHSSAGIADHLAIKLALSKLHMHSIRRPLKIGVVVPVFHETIRIKPRIDTTVSSNWILPSDYEPHPNGENFVYEKARQVAWLIDGIPNIDIRIIYVDDACNRGSGDKIRELLAVNDYARNNEVYHLVDLVNQARKKPESLLAKALTGLQSPEQSQKSGAVYAGMAIAVENHNCDIVIYTDADLSYDLGQIGNLIQPLISGHNYVAVADRRNRSSYTEDVHNTKHQLGKRRMKAILGSLRADLFSKILPSDTQAGFKAIDAKAARTVIEITRKDMSFAFDVQLLARLYFVTDQTPASIATVCIDSPEESTADGTSTYQAMANTYLSVADEFELPSGSESYFILKALAGRMKKNREIVWNALEDLMNERNTLPVKIRNEVLRVRKFFSVKSNNTAVSLPLSEDIIIDLKSIINAILKQSIKER